MIFGESIAVNNKEDTHPWVAAVSGVEALALEVVQAASRAIGAGVRQTLRVEGTARVTAVTRVTVRVELAVAAELANKDRKGRARLGRGLGVGCLGERWGAGTSGGGAGGSG